MPPPFLGSQFFSDTASLAHQALTSRQYELPIFINTKFLKCNPDPRWRRQIRRHAARYQHYYRCSRRYRPQPAAVDLQQFRCPAPQIAERFPLNREQANSLPPNRFSLNAHCLANIVHRSAGNRGPYRCFSAVRDDSTIGGHLALPKFPGSATMFYDVPTEMQRLQQPRQYFRYAIRDGHRFAGDGEEQLNPLVELHRRQPGPTAYYPLNYTLHVARRSWRRPPKPGSYFRHSCVPQNDRFWNRRVASFSPGPGRYSPEEVACPCAAGSSWSAQRERLLERWQAQAAAGRVPATLTLRRCPAPKMRNIRGGGHTSVFRSGCVRLLRWPERGAKGGKKRKGRGDVHLQMELEPRYLKMIANPVRNAISYPTIDLHELQLRPGRLRFNTMERALKRSKLRNNKKVAFNSSTPRWPVNKMDALLAESKTALPVRKSPNMPVIRKSVDERQRQPTWIRASTPAERLQWQPRRYVELRPVVDRSNKMRYTFAALPPARILVEDRLQVDAERLELVNTAVDVEELYTEEVLELKREWEVRKKMFGIA